MDRPESRQIIFSSEHQTRAFGAALATTLISGDALLLTGEIGAGKSVMARAIIQSRMQTAGHIEDVPSPTYTLIQTYELGPITICHADLYRLGGASDLAELGLDELFAKAITIVEWADRLGDAAPGGALWINLAATLDQGQRRAQFSWTDPVWGARLDKLFGEFDG